MFVGQQVTAYPHNDTNNNWQIVPTKEIPESGRGRIVRQHDVIQLLHVNSNSYLMTHDVASPLMPTNQEFTTWPANDTTRHNDTLFTIEMNDAHEGEPFRSKSGHFRLIHVPTKVALWTRVSKLPDWAYGQQEVNGNKAQMDKSNIWFVDDIISDGSE
jgi:dolichyl-phosphate-mannose-protein mannosyltransferase